ncbi:dihydrofolate reductase [Segeticoccus rhizosphaerae]|jgi:dihydrofolate reductase|uniref:dihydrofolate reductase n=1 Tax=Segeticoccus rhizosphaerae TaxID=1104777 RepID=UPI0010C0DE21|nr:dihydrofolate reductase [Ornithinicoccus soli]
MTITLIAAVARGGVIGAGGTMAWHLPEDLKYFKRTTMGHPMVMGRKTFDSMGALPGRRSIVITRRPDWSADGVETAASLEEALRLAGEGEVFVVGGGEVYALALPLADRVLLTELDREVEGDTWFPELDPRVWREVGREEREGFAWVSYARAGAATTA